MGSLLIACACLALAAPPPAEAEAGATRLRHIRVDCYVWEDGELFPQKILRTAKVAASVTVEANGIRVQSEAWGLRDWGLQVKAKVLGGNVTSGQIDFEVTASRLHEFGFPPASLPAMVVVQIVQGTTRTSRPHVSLGPGNAVVVTLIGD
jgi:hypothetical protein